MLETEEIIIMNKWDIVLIDWFCPLIIVLVFEEKKYVEKFTNIMSLKALKN